MRKRAKPLYFLIGLFVFSSLTFNTYVSVWLFKLTEKIEEFYKGDFLEIEDVSKALTGDIEKSYGIKMPPVELNIRLSEYSATGIQFDGKTLKLFFPPKILAFNSDQRRAYMAHEYGHYVLGHINHHNPGIYSFFGGEGNMDIKADSFASEFSKGDSLGEVIENLVWDDRERNMRLIAIFKKVGK